ncbi:putative FMN-binding domain protein [Achromobacter piechaudii ATCC 43553]|uniref:Putative FMN-binding domain protein n=2 Tax=Achromobacter piechaudii TaxID=72556 RepID=D4XGI8_9BURK|nr:putative FMN-binding domain protein [Achromobacter piechaudii ATCC 43553]
MFFSPTTLPAMYLPTAFREDDLAVQHDFIRAHPLGVVMTSGEGGLMANHIPCLLYPEGDHGVLRLHIARANPQLRQLAAGQECLIAFHGAQAYITPSWYATKAETHKVVPTWNFVAVHAWGTPIIQDDPGWLRAQLDALTASQEKARAQPWSVDEAPADFIAAQMRAIVGVEIPISRIEGKWKVSQNRTPADRQGVAQGLASEAGDAVMAGLVARRGAMG